MKTEQMMPVVINGFQLDIEYNIGMGNLTALWEHGNKLREAQGKKFLELKHYLDKPETCEYMLEIERHSISPRVSSDDEGLEIEYLEYFADTPPKIVCRKLTCIKTKSGTYYANLYLLLDAAMTLDPAFRHSVGRVFIEGNISKLWDDVDDVCGNDFQAFNALNAAMKKLWL
jgi:hypothetical protein